MMDARDSHRRARSSCRPACECAQAVDCSTSKRKAAHGTSRKRFEVARINYLRDVVSLNLRENGIIVARNEVNYLKPITLDDDIACYVRITRIGNSSFDTMQVLVKATPGGEEICTVGKTVCISYDYFTNKSVPIPPKERQRMIEFDEPRLILNTN